MTHSESLDEQQRELLAGYVLADLTPTETALVEQQIAQDPALATELQQVNAAFSWLAFAAPALEPPAELRDRLLAQVNAIQGQPMADAPSHSPSPLPFPQPEPHREGDRFRKRLLIPNITWGLVGSMAAVLIAGLGVSNYRLQQEIVTAQTDAQRYRETVAMLQQPNNRMLSLHPVNDTHTSSGSLVIVPQSDISMLTLQNLDSPPAGMVYRMWAVVDGQKVYCGSFMPDNSGQVVLQMPLVSNWESTSSVIINIEPSQEGMSADIEMVLIGESL